MKQKNTKTPAKLFKKTASIAILAVAMVLSVGLSVVPPVVKADSISDQITQLQQENANNRNAVAQLQGQAVSYQDAITRLQSQINILQGQINSSVAKQADLQGKIEQSQRDLEEQKAVLGDNIRVMYVEGKMTTIEMLATSKDLSEFVDKQEYRNTVKNKIQDTLDKIAKLQNELRSQKAEVEALLKEQQNQQAQLDSSRAEQANLLAFNKSQQADYNQKTQANQSKINELIAQQRAANDNISGGYYFLRFPGKVNGHDFSSNDYPYSGAGFSMSTAPGCNDNDGPDRWGYCTRQCVSYTAWAVERSGRSAPRYYGSAKNWVAAARREGVPIYADPQPGDVAISTAGTWGHAMYVEKVNGDQIFVSQYNQQLTGQYSTQWRTYR